MAPQSKGPTHGSGAQTTEFPVDLVAHGHDRPGVPRQLEVLVSTDANGTFQIEARTSAEFADYRLDARVVRGSIEVRRAFRDGVAIESNDLPSWDETVLERAD